MALRDWFGGVGKTELTTEVVAPIAQPAAALDQGVYAGSSDDRVSAFAELGVSGLKRFGGYIYEEILRELTGHTRANATFKEMRDNEPVIGAMLFAIEMLIRGVTWDVQAAGKTSEDLKRRDFVKSCMEDMSTTWTEVITENLSMITYGWSWHEPVYKIRRGDQVQRDVPSSKYKDGLIGWRKMPIRSQDSLLRWEFDASGGVQAMVQLAPPNYQITRLPIEKGLLFRTNQYKNDPQGRSALRNAYVPYYFKKQIMRYEAIGIERDLAGLPVLGVPARLLSSKASTDEKALLAQFQKVVTNIRRDAQEGLVMPLQFDDKGHPLYELKLLSTGGRRQFDTSGVISRYNQEMAVTTLEDFVLIGHGSQQASGGKGGTALVKNKTEIFSLAISAWLDAIAAVYNRYELPRLFRLNGIPVDAMPRLTHGKLEQVDITELGEYISKLAGSGMALFPDDVLENRLRESGGLPLKEGTEDVA